MYTNISEISKQRGKVEETGEAGVVTDEKVGAGREVLKPEAESREIVLKGAEAEMTSMTTEVIERQEGEAVLISGLMICIQVAGVGARVVSLSGGKSK